MILRIPQMPWMLALADGWDGQSLAAEQGGGCGYLWPQAFAAVHLPEDQPVAANFPHDNELSAEIGAAASSMAEGGRGE